MLPCTSRQALWKWKIHRFGWLILLHFFASWIEWKWWLLHRQLWNNSRQCKICQKNKFWAEGVGLVVDFIQRYFSTSYLTTWFKSDQCRHLYRPMLAKIKAIHRKEAYSRRNHVLRGPGKQSLCEKNIELFLWTEHFICTEERQSSKRPTSTSNRRFLACSET